MPALVLLPPSKTMAAGGDGPPWRPAGPLAAPREEVAGAYERTARSNRERFGAAVEADGDLLEETRRLAAGLRSMPTMPAGERYTGQLHAHGAFGDLRGDEREDYARHVRVVSGLLGLVAADEPVPAYRLPMGAALPRVGSLAPFWRPHLTAEVLRQAAGDPVWDLLSAEYQRALDLPDEQRIVVRFERSDGRAAPAVIGKQLKGALARFLSQHGGDPASVGAFEAQGHRMADLRRDGTTTVVFQPDA